MWLKKYTHKLLVIGWALVFSVLLVTCSEPLCVVPNANNNLGLSKGFLIDCDKLDALYSSPVQDIQRTLDIEYKPLSMLDDEKKVFTSWGDFESRYLFKVSGDNITADVGVPLMYQVVITSPSTITPPSTTLYDFTSQEKTYTPDEDGFIYLGLPIITDKDIFDSNFSNISVGDALTIEITITKTGYAPVIQTYNDVAKGGEDIFLQLSIAHDEFRGGILEGEKVFILSSSYSPLVAGHHYNLEYLLDIKNNSDVSVHTEDHASGGIDITAMEKGNAIELTFGSQIDIATYVGIPSKEELKVSIIISSLTDTNSPSSVFRLNDQEQEISVLKTFNIYSPEDLLAIKHDLDGAYVLQNDLDLDGVLWEPVGDGFTPFTGSFDGGAHTIDNLKITSSSDDYVGLFGYVQSARTTSDAPTISDLQLKNVNINNTNTNTNITDIGTGSLVGKLEGGYITKVSVQSGSVSSDTSNVGGLVGVIEASGGIRGNNGVSVEGKTNAASVEGKTNVGGIVGSSGGGEVYGYNIGHVTGNHADSSSIGGLVGQSSGSVFGYVKGITVSGRQQLGGLVGYYHTGSGTMRGYANNITIKNSGASTLQYVGGLVGRIHSDNNPIIEGYVQKLSIVGAIATIGTNDVRYLVGLANTGTIDAFLLYDKTVITTTPISPLLAPNTPNVHAFAVSEVVDYYQVEVSPDTGDYAFGVDIRNSASEFVFIFTFWDDTGVVDGPLGYWNFTVSLPILWDDNSTYFGTQ